MPHHIGHAQEMISTDEAIHKILGTAYKYYTTRKVVHDTTHA
jgi:hypothetical protein